MSGLWIFVCGASGAGKDSVMAWATQHLQDNSDIVFARRMVTRAVHAGSDHDAVTPEQFAELKAVGALAWHWHAHGFGYGIAERYAQHVQRGGLVVVNGSREHAAAVADRTDVRLVQIVVEAEELARRLHGRGRDAPHEVERRMARNSQFSALRSDCSIVNQHSVADAGQQLVAYLRGLTAEAATPVG
jgi:ribose 1,5-bisphosphokinase